MTRTTQANQENNQKAYAQIQKKISILQKAADALRQKEIEGVVDRIKVAIDHYGLTATQLGFGAAGLGVKASSRRPGGKSGGPTTYSDGNGNAWSGRGKRPNWLREALTAGRSLEEFRTGPVAVVSKVTKAKPVKRRPSTVLYRDGAGNSWTGRGPQPRWLKEAIAGGKTLEELKG